jgi:hypothetical protein
MKTITVQLNDGNELVGEIQNTNVLKSPFIGETVTHQCVDERGLIFNVQIHNDENQTK